MVALPAGRFLMGSPDTEEGRYDNEGPQHPVTLAEGFAAGRYPVTRGEYAVFAVETSRAVAGGCWHRDVGQGSNVEDASKSWLRPGFEQGDDHPAVCVSWQDAHEYVRWLSRKTGRPYRLLTEAEWEYAARAGSTTARPWGEQAEEACAYANVMDRTSTRSAPQPKTQRAAKALPTSHACDDGNAYTSPVGRYRGNAFGLHDMIGNSWEWVEDCWHDTYQKAPADGTAWVTGDCSRRVMRGGGWDLIPRNARSANRDSDSPGSRINYLGFRVARSL